MCIKITYHGSSQKVGKKSFVAIFEIFHITWDDVVENILLLEEIEEIVKS